MLKLKLQYFGHLMGRADSFEKTMMLGKIEGGRRRGTTKDKMVGWCHQLNEHGFGWTLGAGDGRGGLACCGSWGRKESDTTERLNWTECLYTAFYVYNVHRGTFFNFTDFSNMQINKEIKTFSRKSQSFPRENSIVLNPSNSKTSVWFHMLF